MREMKTVRRLIFWMHLVTGLVAGLVIAIMGGTGAVLAFEDDIVAWAERDAREVDVPAAAMRLPLAELERRVRRSRPDSSAATITLANDPATAVIFTVGRDDDVLVDPYSGAIREPASGRARALMHVLLEWHRYLGRSGDQRSLGRAVTGACNLAFCALAMTGLYLWWPRRWSWRGVKAIALCNWRLAGRARDFNWHNSVGLWTAPVLIVLTLTAVPISFRWSGDMIHRLVGEEPPARGGPSLGGRAMDEFVTPPTGAAVRSWDEILARAQEAFPRWERITLRRGNPARGSRAMATDAGSADPPRLSPLTVMIRERGSWPRTATTTLMVDAVTGDVTRRVDFHDEPPGRRIRMWMRFLHTGEALGWGGRLIAGIASFGSLVLVGTGFALAARRFLTRRGRPPV
jgi:uncharacterized iron-regulated membrane protein